MAYFFKKKLKGKYYLFAGISKSDGKGNAVRTESKYIGPYDALCDYFKQAEATIMHQAHFEFGLSRALYTIVKQLGMPQIFEQHIKKKSNDPYLAMRIIMMVINRLVWPCAKYSLSKWYLKSDLANTCGMPDSELDSQKVYRTMDKLDEYTMDIEAALCKVISAQEGTSFETLYLDFTNQESYSRNHDSELLDYGHNKRGKDDLFQVNISLCCDADSGIPFFHKSYAGNYNDKQFIHKYAQELRERLTTVGWNKRNLLIIDRGINGKDNFDLLLSYQFDYIGGLIEREFPQYFNIRKSDLTKRYKHMREAPKPPLKIRYISKKEKVYGREHTIVIFYNQENYNEKINQLTIDLSHYESACISKLEEFKHEIMEKTFQSNWNNIEKITKQLQEINKHLFPLFKFKIKSYRFDLSWSIRKNEKAISQYIDKFGKHVLFTNNLEITTKDVLDLFFNKDKIEKNFQFLKSNAYTNRHIVLGPMLHSKDERIKSHVYTCIMALQIYQILRHRISKSNLPFSTQEALEELENIVCYYTKLLGNEDVIRHINQLTGTQKRILKSLKINIFD